MSNQWHIEKESYVNETEYSICTEADQKGMPALCIGVFRGIEQLKGFGDMLQKPLTMEELQVRRERSMNRSSARSARR